jgi:hypothetical protein
MRLLLLLVLSLSSIACLAQTDSTQRPRPAAWCPPQFEDMAALILERRGIANTSTFFPQAEVDDQLRRYPGQVCPAQALALAIEALLASRQQESLFSLSESEGVGDCGAHCYLGRASSLLGIVADGESRLRSRFLPLPPLASSVSEHWIFFLSVPDLGEHGYWALVSRDGSGVVTVARN